MCRAISCLLCALLALAALPGSIAASDAEKTKFTRFDYFLLPAWCETVVVTRAGKAVSELALGEVYRVRSPGAVFYGYRCKRPGHGGASFDCSRAALLLIVYGLNIEGKKERKVTGLCIK
jgi:hypothetical protein